MFGYFKQLLMDNIDICSIQQKRQSRTIPFKVLLLILITAIVHRQRLIVRPPCRQNCFITGSFSSFVHFCSCLYFIFVLFEHFSSRFEFFVNNFLFYWTGKWSGSSWNLEPLFGCLGAFLYIKMYSLLMGFFWLNQSY